MLRGRFWFKSPSQCFPRHLSHSARLTEEFLLLLQHAMLRYVMSRYVVSRHFAIHCYVTLCYLTLSSVPLCYTILCHIMLRYAILRYVMLRKLCHIMLRYASLRYVTLRNIISWNVTLGNATLPYVKRCCYGMLFHPMLFPHVFHTCGETVPLFHHM